MIKFLKLNTGAQIPAIGFGTWQIYLNRRAKSAVIDALHAGYRLIDTARIYGNETGVGQAINESDIAREKIFVTTKLWNASQGYDKTLKAFKGSMKRLDLEYVDLYLIHWPVSGKRSESWKAMTEIYKSGRAKAIGVSNYTVRHLEELLAETSIVPAVNQVEFHPFLYDDQKELLDYCNEHGIIVEAYSPLAHGHRLSDPVISRLASSHKKSNAQILIRWAIQHKTIPLPKSSNPERIHENLDVFDFKLNDKEMSEINSLSEGLRTCWDPSKMA